MNMNQLRQIGYEGRGLLQKVGVKLREISLQSKGDMNVYRLGICCMSLLLLMSIISPLLGLVCIIGAGLYLSK